MSFKVTVAGSDVSAYVIEPFSVFAVSRNRDWTQVFEDLNLVFSESVTPTIGVGNEVCVYMDTVTAYPFYVGLVESVRYGKLEHRRYVTVRHFVTKLRSVVIDYDTLHASISAGAAATQYMASDNWGYPNVQVIWVLEKCFDLVNIEVNLAGIAEVTVKTIDFGGDRIVKVKHLQFDENMMYCINNGIAGDHDLIDGDADYAVNKFTALDLLSEFCSMCGQVDGDNMGFTIGLSTSGTPKTVVLYVRDDSAIVVSDDVRYEDEPDYVAAAEGGYSVTASLSPNRIDYTSPTGVGLTSYETISGVGKNSFSAPPNFVFMFAKFWDTDGYSMGIEDFPLYNLSALEMLRNKLQATMNSWTISKYKTTVQIVGRAKSAEVRCDKYDPAVVLVQEL